MQGLRLQQCKSTCSTLSLQEGICHNDILLKASLSHCHLIISKYDDNMSDFGLIIKVKQKMVLCDYLLNRKRTNPALQHHQPRLFSSNISTGIGLLSCQIQGPGHVFSMHSKGNAVTVERIRHEPGVPDGDTKPDPLDGFPCGFILVPSPPDNGIPPGWPYFGNFPAKAVFRGFAGLYFAAGSLVRGMAMERLRWAANAAVLFNDGAGDVEVVFAHIRFS
ncbi:MAG: hypothetical protein U5K27_20285 [Desulfotignum sp.]|nr:hypothetical protein [Desulfotignum sp.]